MLKNDPDECAETTAQLKGGSNFELLLNSFASSGSRVGAKLLK
jgi:hypothetical protein